jgi:hypothetical protein
MKTRFVFACTSLLEPLTREKVAPGRAILSKRTKVPACLHAAIGLLQFQVDKTS